MYGYQAMSKRFQRGVPFVLDFSIVADQNSSCPPEGQQPPHNYVCLSGNSFCTNTSKLSGYNYVCWCDEYYEGNPYLTNGCQGTQLIN